MMNKKGGLVLRDIIFMMLIMSSIFIFAGIFVSEISQNYDNTNMSDEWALTQTNIIANSTFESTKTNLSNSKDTLSSEGTGIIALIGGTLDGIGDILFMVLTAPNTIGDLVGGTLFDMGVGSAVSNTIKWLIVAILWGIVIFTIGAAFLQGGKI